MSVLFNVANTAMNIMNNGTLGADPTNLPEGARKICSTNGGYVWPAGMDWVDTIVGTVFTILWPLLALVAAAGIIYAIYLGVQLAKAESSDKQDEAKKRIITAIIAMAVVAACILLVQLLMTLLPGWCGAESLDSLKSAGWTEGTDTWKGWVWKI